MNTPEQPKKPQKLSEFALLCLEALSRSDLRDKLSLGGAVGLMHYYEYRTTHDVDAWWLPSTTEADQQAVRILLEETLAPFGEVRTRRWGDVMSIELRQEGRAIFSFQIANRSVLLEAPHPSPWPGVLVDDLHDLIASKMVALVERGAPRDFLDVFNLCQQNMTTPEQCWHLWRARQEAAEDQADTSQATLAIQLHLERIETHRPLANINDLTARESAGRLRHWFRKEFLNAAQG